MIARCSLPTFALVAAFALLAGCGGLAQNSAALNSNGALPDGDGMARGTLTIRIRVPKKHRSALKSHYISPGTKGMTLAFTGEWTYGVSIAITPSDPRCSGSPLVCTIDVGLKPGAYTTTIKAFDKAPVTGVIPGSAKLLSSANHVAVSVKLGKKNALKVMLDGMPASFAVGNFPETDGGTGYLNKPFSVTARDADGYTIVGTYSTAVTLTDTDTSGATAIATTGADNPPDRELISSSDVATVSYTGATVRTPVTITASAGAVHDSGLLFVHLPIYVADRSATAIDEIPPNCTDASCVIRNLGGGFTYPQGVAVDGSGNVFVADLGNNEVKEIPLNCSQTSCVVTLGGGWTSANGVAVDASGNVFVIDHDQLKKMPPGCASSGCVTPLASGFNAGNGIALDRSDNVFVADTNNGAVKEVLAAGGYVTIHTLGGSFNQPWGVALDDSGNVFVAENGAGKVKKIPPGCVSAGCVVTLGGSFAFNGPRGVAVDGLGDLFVADFGGLAVYEMTAGCMSNTCVKTAGGGFGTAPLGGPDGLGIY